MIFTNLFWVWVIGDVGMSPLLFLIYLFGCAFSFSIKFLVLKRDILVMKWIFWSLCVAVLLLYNQFVANFKCI